MAGRLSLPQMARTSTVREVSYNLQNQKRFYAILSAALFLHLLLLGTLDFQFDKASLKKMTASLFEAAIKPQSVTITVKVTGAAPKEYPAMPELEPATIPASALAHEGKKSLTAAQTPQPFALPAQAPVRKRAVSAASHQTKDALYLSRWQAYVEEFGNAHYPEIAQKNNLQGELRLLVGIRRDGSIHEISLRKSSGSTLLDQAAIDLVKAAGPFEPLPPEISQDVEVLEIIRTWQFRDRLHTIG